MMNLDRAYRLLAAFYTLILMIGAIAILAGGRNAALTGISAVGCASGGGSMGIHPQTTFYEPSHVASACRRISGGYLASVIHNAHDAAVERRLDLDAHQQHFFRHAGHHALPLWKPRSTSLGDS